MVLLCISMAVVPENECVRRTGTQESNIVFLARLADGVESVPKKATTMAPPHAATRASGSGD